MKRTNLLWIVFALLLLHPSASGKVWINEFMQSNVDCLVDDTWEFPDSWVELYNDGDEEVNLKQWYLSDKEEIQKSWRIWDEVVIPAKGYLIVYCDERNLPLHTTYRLESGKGCSIYLRNASGTIVDQVVNFPKQPAPNISCGRMVDDIESWGYFVKATPKAANKGVASSIVLPAPQFSVKGGVYQQRVEVELSLPAFVPEGVGLSHLYYTTDGSEPTEESPRYSEPFLFETPTCLRAKLIHPSYLSDRSITQSYIVVDRQLTLPVVSIATNDAFLFDDVFGIYVEGNGSHSQANYMHDWRRPMNIEYFPVVGEESVINQLGELRIGGGYSRQQHPSKTFIVYSNKRFGVKGFNYPLFTAKPDMGIKSFMLRQSGNDFAGLGFRDAITQQFLGRKVDLDYQECQPAIMFINGEYYGFQNFRERSNDDFILSNYDNLEDIDMVENWPNSALELKKGDFKDYNELMEMIQLPLDQVPYEKLMDKIDINEYINYMILQVYISNVDFPQYNVVLWRPRTAGGKWRFLLKDTDHGTNYVNPPSHNSLKYNLDLTIKESPRLLFHRLMNYEPFKKEFYTRFAIYMGDMLHPNTTCALVDSMKVMLDAEIPYHKTRWNNHDRERDYEWWLGAVDRIKGWLTERNTYMYKELNNELKLAGLTKMSVAIADEVDQAPQIMLNDVVLEKPLFDGAYFRNEKIRIALAEKEKNDSVMWRIVMKLYNDTKIIESENGTYSLVVPIDCEEISFELINKRSSIEEQTDSKLRLYTLDNKLFVFGLTGYSYITVYDSSGRLLTDKKDYNHSTEVYLKQKGPLLIRIKDETGIQTQAIINK